MIVVHINTNNSQDRGRPQGCNEQGVAWMAWMITNSLHPMPQSHDFQAASLRAIFEDPVLTSNKHYQITQSRLQDYEDLRRLSSVEHFL